MGWLHQWRYRFCFCFMIIYMFVTCIIACALFWNFAVSGHYAPEEGKNNNINTNSLVPVCTMKQEWFYDSLHNCSAFNNLMFDKFIANGWTKVVHRAKTPNGKIVAVKSVNIEGKDITDCSKSETVLNCGNKATEKLGREIEMLRVLHHETIAEMKFYCMKSDGNHCIKQAAIISELGEPLTNLRLLQMTWKQRLQLIQDLTRILHYAEHSPLGSIRLSDLRRQQFILVDSKLKLADLDDIILGDPSCSSTEECSNMKTVIPCIFNHCSGYNARMNIQKSLVEFGPYIFIKHGVPHDSRSKLERLRLLWQSSNTTTVQLLSTAMLL